MNEYIIDTTIEHIYQCDYSSTIYFTFYIKIKKNGNVDIKKKCTHTQTGVPNWDGPIHNIVIINDNIPIPSYIINMLQNSFCKPTEPIKKLGDSNGSDYRLHLHHYENAIENLIILKEDIAKCSSTIIDLL